MDQLQVETAAIPMDVLTTRRYCPLGLDSAWIRTNSRGATTQDNMAGHIQRRVNSYVTSLTLSSSCARMPEALGLSALRNWMQFHDVWGYVHILMSFAMVLYYYFIFDLSDVF